MAVCGDWGTVYVYGYVSQASISSQHIEPSQHQQLPYITIIMCRSAGLLAVSPALAADGVSFTTPSSNAKVSSPVHVEMAVSGLEVRPAGAQETKGFPTQGSNSGTWVSTGSCSCCTCLVYLATLRMHGWRVQSATRRQQGALCAFRPGMQGSCCSDATTSLLTVSRGRDEFFPEWAPSSANLVVYSSVVHSQGLLLQPRATLTLCASTASQPSLAAP